MQEEVVAIHQQEFKDSTGKVYRLIDPLSPQYSDRYSDEQRRFFQLIDAKIVEKSQEVTVPKFPSDEAIAQIFSTDRLEFVKGNLVELYDYLTKEAIIDRFGNDHNARRKWRGSLETAERRQFEALVNDHNCLRGNSMMPTNLSTQVLAHLYMKANNLDRYEKLRTAFIDLPDNYTYGRMTLNEKITVTRERQHRLVGVLNDQFGSVSEPVTIRVL